MHNKGYGHFQVGKKAEKAHRISYSIFRGKIPDGMHVLHSCDNPPCVNPDHLSLGTNKDNMRDRGLKGRTAFGEMIPQTKLTREQVAAIRREYIPYKITLKMLSKKYGVSQPHISAIISGRRRAR